MMKNFIEQWAPKLAAQQIDQFMEEINLNYFFSRNYSSSTLEAH